jgi:hypothetical protein
MSAEIAAEWVAPSKLTPWDKNPRRNDNAAKRVADSIRRFGFGAPIVARKADGRIIAGHTRFKAAKMLGLKQVPVRYLDVSERDADLLALADNKLGEIAEWDDQAVAQMLSQASLEEAGIAGWDLKELGKMADEMFGPADGDSDSSPKLGTGLTYSVVVECSDEDQQGELLERLELEGFKCKPLVS